MSFPICWVFNCCIIFQQENLFRNIFIIVYYVPPNLKVFIFNISNHYIFNTLFFTMTLTTNSHKSLASHTKAFTSPPVTSQQSTIYPLDLKQHLTIPPAADHQRNFYVIPFIKIPNWTDYQNKPDLRQWSTKLPIKII